MTGSVVVRDRREHPCSLSVNVVVSKKIVGGLVTRRWNACNW